MIVGAAAGYDPGGMWLLGLLMGFLFGRIVFGRRATYRAGVASGEASAAARASADVRTVVVAGNTVTGRGRHVEHYDFHDGGWNDDDLAALGRGIHDHDLGAGADDDDLDLDHDEHDEHDAADRVHHYDDLAAAFRSDLAGRSRPGARAMVAAPLPAGSLGVGGVDQGRPGASAGQR